MPTTCGTGGASAYVRYTSTSVAWSAAGRASVTMTSNQCPSGALAAVYNGVAKTTTSAPTCTQISLPFASAVDAAAPLAAPLRAAVGYTLWGTPIFAPSDDGIATGAACSNNAGSVVAGIDTSVEAARLEYLCGTANVVATALLDDCGACFAVAGFFYSRHNTLDSILDSFHQSHSRRASGALSVPRLALVPVQRQRHVDALAHRRLCTRRARRVWQIRGGRIDAPAARQLRRTSRPDARVLVLGLERRECHCSGAGECVPLYVFNVGFGYAVSRSFVLISSRLSLLAQITCRPRVPASLGVSASTARRTSPWPPRCTQRAARALCRCARAAV